MHPKSNRRLATRTVTSLALVTALATALSFIPLGEARAQHGGHHGHHGHKTQPAAKKKAPARKRSSVAPKAGVHHGHAHSTQAAPTGQAASTAEFQVAHERMMRNMALPYTGDADTDFRIQMIPHHQGAIDMARVAMRHAKDPWTRQLAEAVIVEQQREIAEMQAWLAARGAAAPAGGRPTHVLAADSYRSLHEEPGTRAELRGQSWAPGSGVPAQR